MPDNQPDPRFNSLSPTQQWLSKYLIDTPAEIVRGLIGLDPQNFVPGKTGFGDLDPGGKANAITQLVTAGLPFARIMKGNPVFHGTSKAFDFFDASKNNRDDLLGWMTHFAEEPHYASHYSAAPINAQGKPIDVQWFNPAADPEVARGLRPNTRKAVIDNKNTLDLSQPNFDDMSQALASMNPYDRNEIISEYKKLQKLGAFDGTFGDKPDEWLSSKIRTVYEQNPHGFKRSPFDAIRYWDGNHRAWAVPEETPVYTPWGVPLTKQEAKPLKVVKGE